MDWGAALERADRACSAVLDDSVVTYAPFGGAAVPVDGVFDESYVGVAAGEAGIDAGRPAFFCRMEDLPEDPDQQKLGSIVADGVAYEVERVQKDGQGGVVLLLHRAETPYDESVPGAPEIDVVED